MIKIQATLPTAAFAIRAKPYEVPHVERNITTDKVTISAAAQEQQSSEAQIAARLTKIKSTPAEARSDEDWRYLFANDKKLAEIEAKGDCGQTADEVDYMQKARGFVNTMRNLDCNEKALYDELVSKGNHAAAAGVAEIAFIRELGDSASGLNGASYNPLTTKITAENILQFFRHSVVDPSGEVEKNFQALLTYLQKPTRQDPLNQSQLST